MVARCFSSCWAEPQGAVETSGRKPHGAVMLSAVETSSRQAHTYIIIRQTKGSTTRGSCRLHRQPTEGDCFYNKSLSPFGFYSLLLIKPTFPDRGQRYLAYWAKKNKRLRHSGRLAKQTEYVPVGKLSAAQTADWRGPILYRLLSPFVNFVDTFPDRGQFFV